MKHFKYVIKKINQNIKILIGTLNTISKIPNLISEKGIVQTLNRYCLKNSTVIY